MGQDGCYRDELQIQVLQSYYLYEMSSRGDQKSGHYFRQAVVAFVIAASVVTADLATFSDRVDVRRFVLFGMAGLLAACTVFVTPIKKILT
jgi:hypothetical protein